MRTSMRPRSAGWSRISKRLLPLRAEAAISSASPLNGTAALVAAVTLNGPTGAAVAAVGGSWAWNALVAGAPVSNAVGVCPASAIAEGWWVAVAADVGEEPAEPSAFAGSTMPLPAFSLAAPADCCATSLWAVAFDMAVAEGSAVPGAVPLSVDGGVPACAAPGALSGVDFGTAGFVAVAEAANATSVAAVAAVAPGCVAG